MEIIEPCIYLANLYPAETYYSTVLPKEGIRGSTLPPKPIVIKGGNMSYAGIVIQGIPVNENPEPDKPPEGGQPIDITVFEAERAAWKSQGLTVPVYQKVRHKSALSGPYD
ncbi:MAG: hypothetical protein LBH70_02380 [Spirochaetaceae bacterium]|nr:hypothetical protein [Spirochaetaceae bacterium]